MTPENIKILMWCEDCKTVLHSLTALVTTWNFDKNPFKCHLDYEICWIFNSNHIMQSIKTVRTNVPRAQMKHQPTFTGEEKCPFFLELEWLLHMMMWGVINTLPAATQPSPVWYATGQRIHRIIRPKCRKKETSIETAFVKYNETVSILYMYLC